MISIHGSIQYFVNVAIKSVDASNDVTNFQEKIIVQSPTEHNLMVAICGSAEKIVLLHGGKVVLHASIARKGFAQGESITVHLVVDNETNASVTPMVSLHQVQIYTCGERHKAVENRFPPEAIKGTEIAANVKKNQQLITVPIPEEENLTIKSAMISVKYFVEVALDIPHSVDLRVNLPVVLTSKAFIEQEQSKKSRLEVIST